MSWRIAARLWLEDHRQALGLPISLALIVALWLIFDPHYPARPLTGRIIALEATKQGRGVVSGAVVDIGARPIRVPLPIRYGCEVGDDLKLSRVGIRFGYSYRVADMPHPCARPLPQL